MIVTKEQYGDRWPLTVDHGTLRNDRGACTFQSADGTTYALNGLASSRGLGVDPDPIWATDPSRGVRWDGSEVKKSISALLDAALDMGGV